MKVINIDNNFNEKEIVIEENTHLKIKFTDTKKDLKIYIKDNIHAKVFSIVRNTSNKVEYFIGENSTLIVDKFAVNCNDKIIINLEKEHAEVKYNTGLISSKDSTYKQRVNHNFMNTNSNVVNHALNLSDSTFKFIIDGVIQKNAKNSILKQDNKIINLNSGKSFIEPNLIIDNDEVEANHSAYIGNFDEKIKFYMMSRGIKEKDTFDLLIKSFLLNSMTLYHLDREEILKMIDKEKEGYIE